MSTDCFAKIYNKNTNDVIGEMLANELKIVLDYVEIARCINYGPYVTTARFNASNIQNAMTLAKSKLENVTENIKSKTLMMSQASSAEAIREIQYIISTYDEEFNTLLRVMTMLSYFEGAVACLVENMMVDGKLAYEANGNGHKTHVFMDDVEIEITVK